MYWPRGNKYKNIKTTVDGIEFDSKKEAVRYMELKVLEKAGEIKDLKLQVPFELIPKQADERAVKYLADFVYFDNSKQRKVVEDAKGIRTTTYVIKRKLFKLKYPEYLFVEV